MTLKYNVKDLELVNYKALVNLVAERTDYLVYEVEDVLEGFRQVITEALQNNKEIRFEHLFTIKPKHFAPRTLVTPKTNTTHEVPASTGVTVRASGALKHALNAEKESEEFSDEVSVS